MELILEIFWFIWMLILPILGLTIPIVALVIWIFLVPKVAKMLTWARFKNTSIHAIADDSGYVELVTTNVELPEGVVKTNKGWRFLPSPSWKPLRRRTRKKDEALVAAERVALRKYVLKGLGKPFWFGYAGMVADVNPATLATLQQPSNKLVHNPQIHFNKINSYIESLPEQFIWNKQTKKELTQMLKDLEGNVESQQLTPLDPRAIKEVLPELTPPSLVDAIETYSERVGMLEGDKGYGKTILGIGVIVAMLIFGIIAIMLLR